MNETPQDRGEWLTVEEAAAHWGVSVRRASQLLAKCDDAGLASKTGHRGSWRVNPSRLHEIKGRAVGSPPAAQMPAPAGDLDTRDVLIASQAAEIQGLRETMAERERAHESELAIRDRDLQIAELRSHLSWLARLTAGMVSELDG
mgnify:CR=1 FL=1